MKTTDTQATVSIEDLFRDNNKRILAYIASRINNVADAENLTQDVWLRALTCGHEISAETALPFLYKIACNLINDYLRHRYTMNETKIDMMNGLDEASPVTPEHEIAARQISLLEWKRVECLPTQRRIIYIMSRYEDRNVSDIADTLSLSVRTVENHLRMGRHDVRDYIAAIA